MKYALLIYRDEQERAKLTPEQLQSLLKDYGDFTARITSAGIAHSSERLQSPHTATTVRVRNGTTLMTDGPFAETKEVLGGFYIIDVKDLDEALKWAAQLPGARDGSIEVRPVFAAG